MESVGDMFVACFVVVAEERRRMVKMDLCNRVGCRRDEPGLNFGLR